MKSFKQILLKKVEDDPNLSTLISFISEDRLMELTLESLEKMARPHASMGRGANAAIVSFANNMTNRDVEMLRDALSHHVSHYKSALKHGKRDVADKHLEKIVPLMHLIGRASAHSGGQLGLDYVPLEAWESNYTTVDRRPETGKLIEGTKGLGRRPKKSTGYSKYGVSRAVPDYRYLEMPPHARHPDTRRLPHKGGYPFEEIQVGNPASIDAKQAYLHIEDVGPKDEYTPHPFDYHPINEFADIKQDRLTQDHIHQFAQKLSEWSSSDHYKRWMQSVKDRYARDPEGFKMRGKVKPPHHFEGIKLLEQPEHARATSDIKPIESSPKQMEQPKTETQSSKPASSLTPDLLAHLPEELRNKFTSKVQQSSPPSPAAPAPSKSVGGVTQQPKSSSSTLTPDLMAHLPKDLASKFKT